MMINNRILFFSKLVLTVMMSITVLTYSGISNTISADDDPTTEIIYTVPESWTLSVPATVNANSQNSFSVSLSNVLIESGKELHVTANSPNYSSGWRLKNGNQYLGYDLKSNNEDVIPNDVLLSANSGDPSSTVSKTFTISNIDSSNIAGNFQDTITFTALTSSNIVSYLSFSSPQSFTLMIEVLDNDGDPSTDRKIYNGTVEYSLDGQTWSEYTVGDVINSVDNAIYLRGSDNTFFCDEDARESNTIVLSGTNISCRGNIENLLDYETVASGNHPEMSDYAFSGLFLNCSALSKAPELPATTLTYRCYSQMFRGCTDLTSAPELPATTLADDCYLGMFHDCTGLTSAPALPATTLADDCYAYMFQGCTSLTTATELPATTLAQYCYEHMFYDCTGLTSAPELPATTLAEGCYYNMFYGCTGIKLSATQTGIYQKPYRIPKEGTGTTASYALLDMFTNTGGTFTDTPDINTTYYLAS